MKRSTTLFFLIFLNVNLAGCGLWTSVDPAEIKRMQAEEEHKQSEMVRMLGSTPTCSKSADCAAKWARAKRWVQENTVLKIKKSNDELIETERSPSDSSDLSIQVTKEDEGDGTFTLKLATGCSAILGCKTGNSIAKASFNEYVNGKTQDPKFRP